PRLGYGDRHFHFELLVAELLDGVAPVDQRPSGACVALSSHVASLSMAMPVDGNSYTSELVGEALRSQLAERLPRFAELEAHSGEDAIGLRELDLVVLHDLDAIAARVANVEERARKHLDARFLERASRCLLVVDDEAEMGLLRAWPSLEQGDELVAHPEERGARHVAVHIRGLEEAGVESDCLLD